MQPTETLMSPSTHNFENWFKFLLKPEAVILKQQFEVLESVVWDVLQDSFRNRR